MHQTMEPERTFSLVSVVVTVIGVCGAVYTPAHDPEELENRIPEAAPYETAEAEYFPPPYDEYWKGTANPGQCQSCHRRIFDEWRGSMVANAWRDPVWQGAFLLSARQLSTDGHCSVPAPPDGTDRATQNPFASPNQCASTFDIGRTTDRLSRPGSLLDGFCSRCHMPADYIDNVPLHDVVADRPSGLEHARLSAAFNPTSDAGTGLAFATVEPMLRNTDAGKAGVFCAICHSISSTRDTPYHTLPRTDASTAYAPAQGTASRDQLVPHSADIFQVPDAHARNLGYGIGAGSFRLSPHAIGFPERFGPLTATA